MGHSSEATCVDWAASRTERALCTRPAPPRPGLPRFASGGSAEHRVLEFRVQDQGQPRPQEQTCGQEAALRGFWKASSGPAWPAVQGMMLWWGAPCSGGPRGARLAGGVGQPCGRSPVSPEHSGRVADASLALFQGPVGFPGDPGPPGEPGPAVGARGCRAGGPHGP